MKDLGSRLKPYIPDFEDYHCDVCGKLFKDDDEIVITDDVILHEDECFMAWCYLTFGGNYTYKEYRDEILERLG
ncbi:hypothetical protein ACW2QC_07320 [Virgibacillus sp. FSP13]